MEYEIELKLLTNEQAGEVIETQLLPQLDVKVTQETLVLTNHYFDTPERTLRQHDIGLRIRGNNQTFEQTLKTAGKSMGGLHQRPEYNVSLDESKKQNVKLPELSLFPLSAWPETINLLELQAGIKTLFTTHFERKIFLLEFPHGDIVELVWDRGEVTCGLKSVPICEIELELKTGSTAVIFDIAKQIVNLLPTSIGIESKAARGYSLLNDFSVKKFQPYSHNPADKMPTEAKDFASLLTTQLEDFQKLSAQIRQQYNKALATDINQVLSALAFNLAGFSQHFSCSSLERLHIKLKTLADDWSAVLLQDNQPAAAELLAHAQTTQLQLDIVQCLVEQPWSTEGSGI